MPKRLDVTGQKFGRLTALRYAYTNDKKYAIWECVCDCGNTHFVAAKDLRSGNTTSCGCAKSERVSKLKFKDGRSRERLCGVWESMKKRCYNPNCNIYKYYGGKGVAICEEWHDYPTFREWAFANGYDESAPRWGCTIDRIDSNGNYEPENCRWVSMDVQRKNRGSFGGGVRNPVTGRFERKSNHFEGGAE